MLVVSKVLPGGIGEELAIEPGDKVLSINKSDIKDILDYHFHITGEAVIVEIKSKTGELRAYDIEKDYADTLDIEFDVCPRSCANKCVFCFIDQQPPNMRQSLYVKDDDYRLSFLHGNYVTLTNLSERELKRIVDERLSPLYISIHATDQSVRAKMLGQHKGKDLMNILRLLTEHNILFHGQIVLCPGYNDELILEQTLSDLLTLAPNMLSLAIVPVGLTKYRSELPQIDPVGVKTAQATIRMADEYRQRFLASTGRCTIYIADEIFLKAGYDLPSKDYYDDFPQLENGVGMIRKTLMETNELSKLTPAAHSRYRKVVLVTGTAAGPVLSYAADVLETKLIGLKLTVCPVKNHFLGETITVAGLLSGRDIIRNLKAFESMDLLIIPGVSVRAGCFIDDISLDQLQAAANCPVKSPETLLELYDLLASREE